MCQCLTKNNNHNYQHIIATGVKRQSCQPSSHDTWLLVARGEDSPNTSSFIGGSSATGPTPLGMTGVRVLTLMIRSRNVNQMVVTCGRSHDEAKYITTEQISVIMFVSLTQRFHITGLKEGPLTREVCKSCTLFSVKCLDIQ